MKLVFCYITLLFSASPFVLMGNEYVFANIPWGSSHDSTLKQLKEKYEIVKDLEGTGIIFSGSMAGKFMFGMAHTKQGLGLITISFQRMM